MGCRERECATVLGNAGLREQERYEGHGRWPGREELSHKEKRSGSSRLVTNSRSITYTVYVLHDSTRMLIMYISNSMIGNSFNSVVNAAYTAKTASCLRTRARQPRSSLHPQGPGSRSRKVPLQYELNTRMNSCWDVCLPCLCHVP